MENPPFKLIVVWLSGRDVMSTEKCLIHFMYGVPAGNASLARRNIPLKRKDYFAVLAFR
jgi:hypothetical protein